MVLYASPIWAEALKMTKNKKNIKKVQRSAIMMMSIAYRTISYAALCVLTGNMPIHIKAQLREKIYEVKKGTY